MTKLHVMETTPAKEVKRLKCKIVEEVTAWHEPSVYGSYKRWYGSTADGWFSIYFMRGVLSIAFEEQEMLVKFGVITFAMSDVLLDVLSQNKNSEELYINVAMKYYEESADIEVENLTFDEVLRVLGWTIKDGVKIQQGYVFNE